MMANWILSKVLVVTTALASGTWGFRSHLLERRSPLLSPLVASQPLQHRSNALHPKTPTALNVVTDREPDLVEMMLGGERYEMVPLPDRMCSTTVFVGNFCEFVHDEDLSSLFQTVSALQSVPACVVRKANMQSLRYGFVTFLTEEEKEAAILRFHGSEWRGKRIKVEEIRDNPRCGRVRVPESMVSYVSGSLKKTRTGQVNSMRDARASTPKQKKKKKKAKKRNAHLKSRSKILSRLTVCEREELERADKKGYLTLDGRNAGHGSLSNLCSSEALKGSRLATAHRQRCDERAKPNIILYKASGRGREVLDHLVVDLSPLREEACSKWTDEILVAAEHAEMDLRLTEDTEECATDAAVMREGVANGCNSGKNGAADTSSSRPKPISKLPFVSMGFFVGDRCKAKAMAKELSLLWDLPIVEENCSDDDGDCSRSTSASESSRREGNGKHGKRYNNHHGKPGKKAIHKAQRKRIKREDWEQSMGRYLRY